MAAMRTFGLGVLVSGILVQAALADPLARDAFVNLGSGPYADASTLTSGNAQPWYNSPQVANLFGGTPTAQQQQAFANAILQRVEQAYQLSGVPIALTADPNVPAAHMLSVVSNTLSNTLPDAVGMTYLGGNGFDFIDQAAKSAQSVDQLEWIVAHNVCHELMLAFGVPEVHDKTGNFLDAEMANVGMMTNPQATFSPAAAQDLLSKDLQGTSAQSNPNWVYTPFAQEVAPRPVPEPTTLALWALTTTAVVLSRRSRSRGMSA